MKNLLQKMKKKETKTGNDDALLLSIIEGIEEYMGVTIISKYNNSIRSMIIEDLGRGVTIYSGKGGFGKKGNESKDIDILYTVVTRLEISRLKNEEEKFSTSYFI